MAARQRSSRQGRPSTGRRKGWDSLSASTRRRYERSGVDRRSYERGVSLARARGHARTPEHPDRAVRDPNRYHGYLVGKGQESMRATTTEGRRSVTGINARERSLLGGHNNAIRTYLAGRDPGGGALAKFKGKRVGGYELEADPDRVAVIALGEQESYESIYEGVA